MPRRGGWAASAGSSALGVLLLLSSRPGLASRLWWRCFAPSRLLRVGSCWCPACVRPLWLRPWFRPFLAVAGRLSGSRCCCLASVGSWLLSVAAPWLRASSVRWAAWGVVASSSLLRPLPLGCPVPCAPLRVWRAWVCSASAAALAVLGCAAAKNR